jgi:hypothetical protein
VFIRKSQASIVIPHLWDKVRWSLSLTALVRRRKMPRSRLKKAEKAMGARP